MLWQYLFEREVEAASETLRQVAEARVEGAERRDRATAALEQRVARLELALAATTKLLELRAGIRREELALMIQQIDLSDGVEDGRIGLDRSTDALKCPHCARPVNPRREACVYCNGALEVAAEASAGPYRGGAAQPLRRAPRTPEMVTCVSCGVELPLEQSDLSVEGIVCAKCSRLVNR